MALLRTPKFPIEPSRVSRRDHVGHHHGANIASRTRMIVLRLVLNSRARADTVAPCSE